MDEDKSNPVAGPGGPSSNQRPGITHYLYDFFGGTWSLPGRSSARGDFKNRRDVRRPSKPSAAADPPLEVDAMSSPRGLKLVVGPLGCGRCCCGVECG